MENPITIAAIEKKAVITLTPIEVKFDLEATNAAVDLFLERYQSLTFSEENISAARTDMAELNKLAKSIKDAVAVQEKIATTELVKLKEDVKTLTAKVLEVRSSISSQVETYDSKREKKAQDLIDTLTSDEYKAREVQERFQRVAPIAKRGHLTAKDNLTKAAISLVKAHVPECLANQNRFKVRVATAESESLKAGLRSPLTEENIKYFIEADDAVFSSELKKLIDSELERQVVADHTNEQAQNRVASIRSSIAPAPEPVIEEAIEEPVAKPIEEPVEEFAEEDQETRADLPAGFDEFQITINLSMGFDARVKDAQVLQGIEEAIQKSSFGKHLQNISVNRIKNTEESTEVAAIVCHECQDELTESDIREFDGMCSFCRGDSEAHATWESHNFGAN